ncbi:hypothetical protein JKP88DRAFT_161576, partial [Tribonema minus]
MSTHSNASASSKELLHLAFTSSRGRQDTGSHHSSRHKPIVVTKDVIKAAELLGMVLPDDERYLQIAVDCVSAVDFPDWEMLTDEGTGELYYWNQSAKVSAWENPKHEYYKNLFLQRKA